VNRNIKFISGYGDRQYVEGAKKIEPYGYVMKPFDEKEVRAFIEIALHKRQLELKLRKAHEELQEVNRELELEIADRKMAEESLLESEGKYKQLLNHAPAGIYEVEEMVFEAIQAMLERLSYRVIMAESGKAAVRIAETFDGQIDLALLDIKMPDIDGADVYPLLMKARPQLKVIVFSGYSIDGPAQAILDAGAEGFIQKPFSFTELSQKVKEVLEGK